MRKYRFKPEQRLAIWRVYDKKCFYCKEPIGFQELTVDHVLPESLLDKPDELMALIKQYGLGDDFSINDYCNWVPAHNHCNREKGTTIYDASPAMIKTLAIVRKKADLARAEEEKITREQRTGDLLGKLEVAYRKGIISKEEWVAKIEYDYNQEMLLLEHGLEQDKEETKRQNDAIQFLRAEREYARKVKLAEEQRNLALEYLDDVLYKIASSPDRAIAQLDEELLKSVVDLLRETVVLVECLVDGKKIRGSGFFVSSEGFLVCVLAALVDSDEILVTWRDNSYRAEIVARDEDAALAIIKINNGTFPFLTMSGDSHPVYNESVFVLGPDSKVGWVITTGRVFETVIKSQKPYIKAQIEAKPGCAGAPVVNESGQIVGVDAIIEDDGITSLLIPTNSVVQFIEDNLASN